MGESNDGPAAAAAAAAAGGGDREAAAAAAEGVDVSVDDALYLAIRVQARRLKRSEEAVFDEALRDWLAKTVDERPSVPERLAESVRAFCRDLGEPAAVALADFLDALREDRAAATAAARRGEEAPRRGRRGSAGKASPPA